MVRNGNLVMYDKKTGTLWLQETGQALEGELSRKGRSTPACDGTSGWKNIRSRRYCTAIIAYPA